MHLNIYDLKFLLDFETLFDQLFFFLFLNVHSGYKEYSYVNMSEQKN